MRLIFGFEMRWYMRILNSVLETASKYPQLAICLLVQKLTKLDYHRHPQTDASQSSLDSAQFSIVFLQHMMDSTCLYMLQQTRGCPHLSPIAALFWKLLPSLGSLLQTDLRLLRGVGGCGCQVVAKSLPCWGALEQKPKPVVKWCEMPTLSTFLPC